MKKLLLVLCVLCAALLIAQAVPAATIIVLNETEPPVVSLERVTVAGDIEANTLAVAGSGEVLSGEMAKVYLFGPSEDIVIKDIAVRHKIGDVAQLRDLYKYLVTHFATGFSLNSLKNTRDIS